MRVAPHRRALRGCVFAALGLLAILAGVPAASTLAAVGDTPVVSSAVSRKVHGAAGTFDLPLSLTLANPTTEPRSGPAHTIVFVFDKAVTGGTAAVTEGTAAAGSPTFAGNAMIVALSGVANQQYVTVAVSNVVAGDGGTGGSGSVRVGFMQGDVSQNRVVTLADLGQVNAQVAQLVTAANFLKDVNTSGTLSLADKGITNTQLTKALAAVPPPANQPPHVNAGANQGVALADGVSLIGNSNDDGLPTPVTLTWSKVSGPGTVNFANPNSAATSATFSVAGDYVLRLTASDGVLTNADDLLVSVTEGGTGLPPDPATVAPPVQAGVATNLGTSTAFLYTGTNPTQTGVVPGTIDVTRAAVLRGRVFDRGGSPLPGVTIGVNFHPEFGQTISRADGRFDLAVNGGGLLTVNYAKSGFLPAQRNINVTWRDFASLDNVALIPLDALVTALAANAATMQMHQGSVMADADGSRRATLLFPAGTLANLVMPDGSTQPLSNFSVRATEYTVGPNGPMAMPGPLPPTSAYTYAVELSADEAIAANATSVAFNQPVIQYVENFLSLPVGTAVPVGYYDRDKAVWVPSANGRVIRIVSVSGGLANVDSVGSGSLAPLVLSDAERAQLAVLYPINQQLWRVAISHFSPWDCNWPFVPPPDATAPNQPPPKTDVTFDKCGGNVLGSIIECQNQILGKSVAIVGTGYSLNYRSDRVPGRVAARTVSLQASGATVPASLKAIIVSVDVAGQILSQTLAAGSNQSASITWDGLDVYGRPLNGQQRFRASIAYQYDAVYATPANTAASFGQSGGAAFAANRGRQEFSSSQTLSGTIGNAPDARGTGVGGWTLDVHHAYDPSAKILYLGDGRRQRSESVVNFVATYAGSGGFGGAGDNGPATAATFVSPVSVAVGPDGSVYIGDLGDRVRRVGPDGIITTFAGTGVGGFGGDGGLATGAQINNPFALSLGADGSLYIADQGNHRIRRVAPDGKISTIAGTGVLGFSGDGGPATAAQIRSPLGVAAGADGSVYIADTGNIRIRRIGPDGIITTVAGTGANGTGGPVSGDGGFATLANLSPPGSVAVGGDGSFYLSDEFNHRIRRVGLDGIITTVAGTGAFGFNGDGIPATQATINRPGGLTVGADSSLLIADKNNLRIRRVAPDGIITTVAGNGAGGFGGDGGPGGQAQIGKAESAAQGPDGRIFIADRDNNRVRSLASVLPNFAASDIGIPSEDGNLLYQFDALGRHLRTYHALTGTILFEFGYDSAGLLVQIVEKTGGTDNVTAIQRDGNGKPSKIVGPYGQETSLTVDANGFLANILNPAGEVNQVTYTADGLLQTFTDPRGKTSQYAYDGLGRLIMATDAVGGAQTIARSELANGYSVTRTTPLGRATTYKVEQLPAGDRKLTNTLPGGESTQVLIKADGTNVATHADGTVITSVLGPDPRFGMQAPIAKSITIATPNGLSRVSTTSLAATFADPANPLSLTVLTRTLVVNGRTTTSTYTGATRSLVRTTPVGRTHTMTLDAFGRVMAVQDAGLDAVTIAFDTRGRPAVFTAGSGPGARTLAYGYNAQGFIQTITDPIGRVAQFAYDAAGRVTTKTLPDGQVINFTYDAAGNAASVTPPGRPAHSFVYSNRNELTAETPPAVPGTGPMSFAYNADRALIESLHADNRKVTIGYDTAGRPVSRALSTNGALTSTDTSSYDGQGRVIGVVANGVNGSYAYDGALPTTESSTGAIVGTVSRTYDTTFRLSSQSVNGGAAVAFGYDNDDLLTSAGGLAVTRNAQNGFPTGSALGVVSTTLGRTTFGELSSLGASASGTAFFTLGFTRDGVGRLSAKAETIGGVTDNYAYAYDTRGHLAQVSKNGIAVETYGYDANGNRTSATVQGAPATATYDAQDRLIQYGSAVYTHTAAGDVLSRSIGGQTTTYQYDQLGNLLGVTLPGGTAIGYVVDGRGRRVGKKINGVLAKGFVYNDALRPVAELDALGSVSSRFVYAGATTPEYLVKAGTNYRILTDQLGSVRLVVDATTGAIAQRIDYDAFGNVVQDTSPGFQPFGFAGGLYDADTGLVRFGARDYDATTGRWMAKDPIGFGGASSNLYAYVANDPVNLVDATGLQSSNGSPGQSLGDPIVLQPGGTAPESPWGPFPSSMLRLVYWPEEQSIGQPEDQSLVPPPRRSKPLSIDDVEQRDQMCYDATVREVPTEPDMFFPKLWGWLSEQFGNRTAPTYPPGGSANGVRG